MYDLLKQNRPLSAHTIELAVTILTGLFVFAGLFWVMFIFKWLFKGGGFLLELFGLSLGLGVGLAIYLMVRLLADTLMALRHMNDRILILSDRLTDRRGPGLASAAPSKATASAVSKAEIQKKPSAPKASAPKARAPKASAPKAAKKDDGPSGQDA